MKVYVCARQDQTKIYSLPSRKRNQSCYKEEKLDDVSAMSNQEKIEKWMFFQNGAHGRRIYASSACESGMMSGDSHVYNFGAKVQFLERTVRTFVAEALQLRVV